MTTIVEIIGKLAPKASPNYLKAFTDDSALLKTSGITTPIRISHFLAQVLHESGGCTVLFENLRYTTGQRLLQIFGVGNHSAAIRPDEVAHLLNNPEGLAERVYGAFGNPKKAKELGNTKEGDGYRYRGGGLLQTTGGDNYRRMGVKANADFYGNPDLIVDPLYALKPAVYEWDECDCNAYADADDIRKITRCINGGYNGLGERRAWFNRIWPLANGGKPAPAWEAAKPDEETRWLQESLNDLGANPQLIVDGRYGPETTEAVNWFQALASLKVDGIAGEVTRAAIRLRLGAK